MDITARRARVRALAKINLGLKVLYKRPDNFHELRTVFQTISLGDTLDIEFTPARRTLIEATPEIPNNLIVRAACAVFDAARKTGCLGVRLNKKVPMGGGLGGGSSDAAAILLALPVLCGAKLTLETRLKLAADLGSDVPFFLAGGTAVALGRGTELYPLDDAPKQQGLVVAPGIHVSTPEAYKALRRGLTSDDNFNYINSFQAGVWEMESWRCPPGRRPASENDFESVVFDLYPRLKSLKSQLLRLGATSAMMSGSGSALFAFFDSRPKLEIARTRLGSESVFPIRTVTRTQYQTMWWRSLAPHISEKVWPPQSRSAR
jgi:4-diphosphocytidyl-2-C-methyl-D-erythritol kinase